MHPFRLRGFLDPVDLLRVSIPSGLMPPFRLPLRSIAWEVVQNNGVRGTGFLRFLGVEA